MAETSGGARRGTTQPQGSQWVAGPHLFSGVALELSGTLSILMGAASIGQGAIFRASGYAYRFNVTAWGWMHVVIGLVLIAAGLGVLLGQRWAKGAGVAVGAVSLITQFMFIPYYPMWSIIVMVLDLTAIWALARFSAT
ncbi:hypothetical protein AB0L47_19275 [Streptomyces bobili]|uniref:DUF7144 family membrane protein n=1 Tax=Streptomyces bobili TaxID=67280 RepID=UPI002250F9DC|nr:hypothetical protein [Streptomyces bobili]MCX5527066.1 hypothetical protein [Streptomyces bobili]